MKTYFRRADVLTSVAFGVSYGVLAQLVVRLDMLEGLYGVMSFGYVFLLPLALGAASSLLGERERGLWATLWAALLTSSLCLLFAFVVGWEGSICLIMAAPVYSVLALLGGLFGYLVRRAMRPSTGPRRMMLGSFLTLPLASAAFEHGLADAAEVRVVSNSVDIDASASDVWPLIARVRRIDEPQESLFFTMGFPRPVEATLSAERVGGVRHASFERGLTFIETVTEWQPPRSLRFAIEVDPSHTPLTTLDAHVTVGGRYFDVLEGGYRIEPLGPSRVRLHLDSKHRISTHYNAYTSLWSRHLMSEIQRNILRVIRTRAERASTGT